MKRLLHEPLVHFMLLGVLVFVGFRFFSKTDSDQPDTIVVTQGRIESLVTVFTRTWQRPPTQTELDGLIRDYVREEVCAREAVTLGLDKDDTVIRKRLRQKLEFISDSVAAELAPTDTELQKYLDANLDKFRTEKKLTFRQVYFDPQRHGQNLSRDITQLLDQLREAGAGADISHFGDSVLLDQEYAGLPVGEIGKQFGEKFVARLGELPIGEWHGPIESGYGVHVVLVTNRGEGRTPLLKEVREAVRTDWLTAKRQEMNEHFYQALLKRYTVTIGSAQVAMTSQPDKQ